MTSPTVSLPEPRRGLRHWLRGYRTMLLFETLNLRVWLAFALVIQVLMSGGMVYMYGFYFGDVPPQAQAFLVSGIPALALVPIGFVVVPNIIMQYKFRETYDYVWSLPVPRLASAAATFTIATVLAIPGTAVAFAIARIGYEVPLDPSWMVVPAVLLVSLMATSVGYTFGHAIPDPRVANLLTNLIIFLVLLFSPIVVPIDFFPDWWASVHRILPFWHMANVIRDGLTSGLVDDATSSYLVLIVWALSGWALSGRIITRRG